MRTKMLVTTACLVLAGSAGAQAPEASKKELEAKLRQARTAANQAVSALFKAKTPADVTAEKLAALEKGIADVESLNAGVEGYKYRLSTFRLLSQWNKADAEVGKAMAEELGAELVASGVSTGKGLKVEISAKADSCYVLTGVFKSSSGSEEVKDPFWTAAGAGTRPQAFRIGKGDGWGGSDVEAFGFCMTRSAKATAAANLVFAGTTNGLRYVVLGWEKAKFPMLLAAGMTRASIDRCDPESWVEQWTRPIPGTLAYVDNEPVLIQFASPDRKEFVYEKLNVGYTTITAQHASTEPPASLAVKTQFEFNGCEVEPKPGQPLSPTAQAIADCNARIAKKYAPKWAEIDSARAKAAAKGIVSEALEAKAAKLKDTQAEDRFKSCGPMEAKAKAKAQEMFDKVVDALVGARTKDVLSRAEYLTSLRQ